MKIGIGQIAPVILDRHATLEKAAAAVNEAASQGCSLVCFGETLAPAYPFWLCRTDAARFEADDQKELHALYLREAVSIPAGHLEGLREAARRAGAAVVIGVAERAEDRAGHTIYCSRVFINADGKVDSVHRKLMPTYEERLSWGIGDGAGLVTHQVGDFTLGALNCWENWMPLARAALYGQGEDLHVAIWPGCERLTRDITRFIAQEARSYVISASSIIREQDVPSGVPGRDRMVAPGETIYDGGSCVAGPDGRWITPPVVGREGLITCEIQHEQVRRERHSFDPSGHYARPDVLRLVVNRARQTPVTFQGDEAGAP